MTITKKVPKFKVGDIVYYYPQDTYNFFNINRGKIVDISFGDYEFSGEKENIFVEELRYIIKSDSQDFVDSEIEDRILTEMQLMENFNKWIKNDNN